MSQENVELVERAMSAFNRLDVEAFVELTTDDYEWFPSMSSAVEGESFRAREGVEAYFRAVSDTWAQSCVTPDEVRDLRDRVVVLGRNSARGRTSGVQVDAFIGMVIDIRNNKIARVRAFVDRDATLKAAGLEG